LLTHEPKIVPYVTLIKLVDKQLQRKSEARIIHHGVFVTRYGIGGFALAASGAKKFWPHVGDVVNDRRDDGGTTSEGYG
jgi:hypothetical protein